MHVSFDEKEYLIIRINTSSLPQNLETYCSVQSFLKAVSKHNILQSCLHLRMED